MVAFIRKMLMILIGAGYSIGVISAEPSEHNAQNLIAVGESVPSIESSLVNRHKPIVLSSHDFGIHWDRPTLSGIPQDDTFDTTEDTDNHNLVSVSCAQGPNAACYAVGWDFKLEKQLLFVSQDSGNTWSELYTPYDLYPIKIACTGNNPQTTTCAIIARKDGQVFTITNHSGGEYFGIEQMVRPFMVQPFLVDGDVSCTGYGDDTRCVYVSGTVHKNSYEPLIYTNSDKNYFWKQKTISGSLKSGSLWKVSCAGKGDAALCAAIGGESLLSGKPIMTVSTNGGNTWDEPDVMQQLSQDKKLTSVRCVNNDAVNFCVAAGTSAVAYFNDSDTKPVFITHTREDSHGRIHAPKALQHYRGSIEDLTCTATQEGSSLCVAIGLRAPKTRLPVILVSADQGNTWRIKTVANLTAKHYLSQMMCVPQQNKIACFASGGSLKYDVSPFFMSSIDMGDTWVFSRPVPAHAEITDIAVTD